MKDLKTRFNEISSIWVTYPVDTMSWRFCRVIYILKKRLKEHCNMVMLLYACESMAWSLPDSQ